MKILKRNNVQHVSTWVLLSLLISSCFVNPEIPKLDTKIADLSQTEAKFITHIISDGGSDIFQIGTCWSNKPNPTLSDQISGVDKKDGDLVTTLNLNFTSGKYYVRSFAVNGAGIGYGPEISLSVVHIEIGWENLTGSTVDIVGRLSSEETITSRGVCWSTLPNPTKEDNNKEEGGGNGVFVSTITNLSLGTIYHARVYATNTSGTFYSEDFSFTTKRLPTVTTSQIKNIGTFIPTSGGSVINTGDAIIDKVGICWSKNPMPTLDNEKTVDNLYYTTTIFNSQLSGLLPSTTYYVRAYATNSAGTGYGEERTVTTPAPSVVDVDGNAYSSVVIGTQEWTVENLRTSKFNNGEPIPYITDKTSWLNTSSSAWCYMNNDIQFESPYGKLYNWMAVVDNRNLCPNGWHVPSVDEWTVLVNYLGGLDVAGGKLKEVGNHHWSDFNNGATNSSGFTALAGAGRSGEIAGEFGVGSSALFWSKTLSTTNYAYYFALHWHTPVATLSTFRVQSGFSVRCIKD